MQWKRKLSGVLAAAMLVGVMPTTALAWDAPTNSWKEASRDGVAARFFVGSDTHIGRNNDASKKLTNALSAFSQVDPNATGVLLAGDVTNNGTESEYDSLMSIINESKLGKAGKVKLSMGNHEYHTGDMARFESKTEQNANQVIYYNQDQEGDTVTESATAGDTLVATVIKLSADSSGGDYTGQYDMVNTALKTSTSKNQNAPVIIIGHHGIPNTAYVTNEWKGTYGAMVDLFKQYPQVIHISGHSHSTLEDARSIYQDDGYTAIQDGTIGAYFENESGKIDQTTGKDSTYPENDEIASQALRIDVGTDGTVTIYRMNLTTGEYMYEDEPWTFNVSNKSSLVYTKIRENSAAPAFAEDAQVTATSASGTAMTVKFPAATPATVSNTDMIHEYWITLTNTKTEEAVTKKVFADYYEASPKTQWSVKIKDLTANTPYFVTVKAVTSFGIKSAGITTAAPITTGQGYQAVYPAQAILDVDFSKNATGADAKEHTLTTYGTPEFKEDSTLGRTVACFDGVDDGLRYAMTSDDYEKLTKNFTIELYYKPLDTENNNPMGNTQSSGFCFEQKSDTNTLQFWAHIGGAYQKPEAAVVQGAWNHVVGTYDGQKVKIYLNGELQNTVSAAGELSEPPHYLFLGGDTTSGGELEYQAHCQIALARVYTGTMTADDVKAAYQAASKTSETPNPPSVTLPTADMLDVDFSDGTAKDTSETNNTARTVGSPAIQDDADFGKKVAAFNGSYDAYMYPFDDTKYGKMTNAVTIESVFCYNEVPASGEHDIFSNQQSGGIGLGLENGNLQFYCNINKTAGGHGYVQPDAQIEAGKWYHAVGTFDGSKVRLYLNGELVAEKDAGGSTVHWTTSAGAKNFVIGGDSDGSDSAQFFSNGSVSLARLYSKAMSAEQVAQAYAALDPVMLDFNGSVGSLALNQGCTVPTATASNGSAVTVTVTDPDGAAITLTDGKFTPSKEGIYTFVYRTEDGKKTQTIVRKAVDMDNLPVTLGLVSADQAAAGGQFNVSVHLNRDSGLTVGKTEFDLTYNTDAVSYIGAENTKDGLTITDNGNGNLHMAYTGGVSTENFGNYSATRLVKLTFAAKASDENKTAAFTFMNVSIDASTNKKIAEPKTVIIYGKGKLDLNGDGVIGAGDVALATSDSQRKLIAAQAAIYPYKHVVMLTMDGGGICFRPDKMYYAADGQTTLTDDAAIMAKRTNDYAMKLFNEYCATSYSAKSETPTISAQNYTSLLHGKEYATAQSENKIDNTKTGAYYYPDFGKETAVYPSVFQALGLSFHNRSNAAFAEWTQIVNGIIEPDAPVYTHGSTHSDGDMQDVADYIRSDAFKNTAMVYMQSDEMDAAGHGHGYYTDYYYTQLKKFDGYFKSIMDALEATNTKDETLVLFTADHGGTIGGSHGGTTNQEYDVQIALGGQTIDSGKRLTGGTNHDPSIIALTALRGAVPDSMDGTADLLTQASLSQEQLVSKQRNVEKVTATAGTNVNALELKLSNVQTGRTIKTLDAIIALNGQTVTEVSTTGTVVRQEIKNGSLYLTVVYDKTPETLARINLSGSASGAKVTEYMLGSTDGKEVYGDLVNTEGTLTGTSSGGSSSGGHHGGSSSGGSSSGSTKPSTPTPTPAPSVSFGDVASNAWYKTAVDYVMGKGLMTGTGEKEFSPEASMTRAMLMTVLARYAGEKTDGGATWYEKGMAWAKANGISDGSTPNANITREQLVTMLYRYAGSLTTSGDLTSFTDADTISSYARQAMQWAVEQGILTGTTPTTLTPQGQATRAQVATILMRFCKQQ